MKGKAVGAAKRNFALMPENLCGNHRNSAKNEGIQYSEYGRKKVLMENKNQPHWAKVYFRN